MRLTVAEISAIRAPSRHGSPDRSPPLSSEAMFDDLARHRVHDGGVRRNLARHQRLPEPPARVDEDLVEVVGQRIQRKGDTGDLAVHELLHDYGDRRVEVSQPISRL